MLTLKNFSGKRPPVSSTPFKHLPPAELRYRPSFFLASGFFSGYAPYSPGTAGSIAYLILWLVVAQSGMWSSLFFQAANVVVVVIVGFLATESCLHRLYPDESPITSNQKIDPQFVVIDEWAGMAISLFGVSQDGVIWPLLALALFRLFDITKPGPVRIMEGLPGSAGIMLDDMVAGLMALVVLQLIFAVV
jgi:phosphatidylglycerophosphatase A